MRPFEDLAIRARNWFWYWTVRNLSGLSNDALDVLIFGPGPRRRHFEGIQKSGSNPKAMALVDGKTVLAFVDALVHPDDEKAGRFTPATRLFESKLWIVLSEPDLAPAAFTAIVEDYVDAMGWVRVAPRNVALYLTFLGPSEPAVQPGVSTAYSAMLHRLVNEATPDALAVLIALFREAMFGLNLEEAIAIKAALSGATVWMCQQNNIPDEVAQLLLRLVKDRILANIWVTDEDLLQAVPLGKGKFSSRERVRQLRERVKAYAEGTMLPRVATHGRFPIVPRSPRLDWVRDHHDDLHDLRLRVGELQSESCTFEDSSIPELRDHAQWARSEAESLLRDCVPPTQESVRFYTERPALLIGGLMPPY